jgi:hypothetical protein
MARCSRRLWLEVRKCCVPSGLLSIVLSGCSDDPPNAANTRVTCSSELDVCDVHSAQCRQRIFDRVGCMRGHSTRETPPPIEFIQLSELLAAIQEEEAQAPDPDAEAERRGLSLLGLVAPSDIAADEAAAERLEGLAALYIPESKQVVMIEDPDGDQPTEEQLGIPVDVFNMTVLAHEYAHAYQDREYDLTKFQRGIPDNFDGQLAGISAVEGEATLFEYEFLLDVLKRQDADRRRLFEGLVDEAERALAESDSPWLAARGIFPYTYGAHSAWSIQASKGLDGLEQLRQSTTTSSYLERRYGKLETDLSDARVPSPADAGLDPVVRNDLGAWLLNGFVSRALGVSVQTAIRAALQWNSDEVSVWRGPNEEVLTNWVVAFNPSTARPETDDGGVAWSWPDSATPLAEIDPPLEGSGWLVSVGSQALTITTSTDRESSALERLHQGEKPSTEDAFTSNIDAAPPSLPSFTFKRITPALERQRKPMAVSAERIGNENEVRRRLLSKVSPLLRQVK